MQRELAQRDTLLRTVFSKTLRDQRRALAWWALGFVGTVFMYASFWPSVREYAGGFNAYIQKLPQAIRNLIGNTDFGTPAGYLKSELFTFLGPILLLVFATGAGARAIAGEEEAGTLDLLLSTPVARRRVYLDKFWAMVGGTFSLAFLMWAAIMLIGRPYDLTVATANLTAMVVNLFLLALAFGSLAMAVGAATGSRGLAIGLTSGTALVTFLVNALTSVEALKVASPFHYYSSHDPIVSGFQPVDVLVLASIAAACLAAGISAFELRDLST